MYLKLIYQNVYFIHILQLIILHQNLGGRFYKDDFSHSVVMIASCIGFYTRLFHLHLQNVPCLFKHSMIIAGVGFCTHLFNLYFMHFLESVPIRMTLCKVPTMFKLYKVNKCTT